MVIDHVSNLSKYASLNPRFEKAFAFLQKLIDTKAPDGHHVLEGTEIPEEIYVNLSTNHNEFRENAVAESHKKYIDVQVLFEGDEIMYVPAKTPAVTTEYDDAKDFMLYAPVSIDDCQRLIVTENSFAIFFPEELHAPCHSVEKKQTVVRKAVLKVLA